MASMIEYKRMLAERDLASVWPQWRIVKLLGSVLLDDHRL